MKKAKTPAVASKASRSTAPTPAPPFAPEDKARMALLPSINAAVVMDAYQGNLLGADTSLEGLVQGLKASMKRSKNGDLYTLEAMLIGQATALQSIFASLARRAQVQESQRNLEAFLGLALKAQSQSRATISALVDLKFPRQATFVKQANIAHGPQQVNNGPEVRNSSLALERAEENQSAQNKLLEVDHGQPGGWVDGGAAAAPTRGNPSMETMVKGNRPKKPRG